MQYRLLTRRRKSCRVDFHYRRLRWRLRVRLRFRCEGSEDSIGSCRMVGSPFPPPKLMTIDCAIPTAKAARRFTRGLRLRMRSLYGNDYWACEPVCVKYVLSDAAAELSGLETRYCSPRADRSPYGTPAIVDFDTDELCRQVRKPVQMSTENDIEMPIIISSDLEWSCFRSTVCRLRRSSVRVLSWCGHKQETLMQLARVNPRLMVDTKFCDKFGRNGTSAMNSILTIM